MSLTALTSILLLIFMSNQFVHYLARAARGGLPAIVVLKLMMLEIPNLIGLLLPLGLYMAILVAYGRLYAENEMTVLHACGYSQNQLMRNSLILGAATAILVLLLMLWVSPEIAKDREQLIRGGGTQALIQTIIPERFRAIKGGRYVFYVDDMNREHSQAQGIFFAKRKNKSQHEPKSWDIVWAKQGAPKVDPSTGRLYLVLEDGQQYQGVAGRGDFKVATFKQYQVQIPQPPPMNLSKVSTLPTKELLPWMNPDKAKLAELQWRLSVPIMTLVLCLLAVPLAKVNPRQGKYAKLFPAILIYILYANGMFVARDWIADGRLPGWLGLWWLHLTFIGLALILIRRANKN